MDRMTPDQLLLLTEAGKAPCVSVYMPTHRLGRETQGDPVRLKNLLADAERQLEEAGMRPTLARDLVAQAQTILDDPDFWLHSSDSLAVFLADGFFRYYRLPLQVEPIAHVNDHFYIKPLLPMISDKSFHVLAVSLNSARLLECTPFGARRVPLPADVATSFQEARGGKDHHVDRGLWRQGGGIRAQASIGDVHGHGPDQDHEQRENMLFYMRQLDEGVRRAVGEDKPLIVAGVNSTTPYYFEVSKHRELVRDPLEGNFEHEPDEKVRDLALEIMEPRWRERMNSVTERFGTAQAQGIASADIAEIVRAAGEGRVDTLIVSPAASVWGDLDQATNLATVKEGGQEDLVQVAVERTLRAHGSVVVAEDNVPGNREAAAIYRY